MRAIEKLIVAVALLAALVPVVASDTARATVPVAVTFSPALQAKLASTYGREEAPVLRAYVTDAVGRALGQDATARARARGLRVAVVIVAAQASHPTRRQVSDNPSIDALLSTSLGGAELTGTVRAADGRVIASVSHEQFAPSLEIASAAGDPWADARRAIQEFATKLAARIAAIR
ncbi:MAG: hypothetical protein WCE48_01570 [Steroidobacteraceae bacterium]